LAQRIAMRDGAEKSVGRRILLSLKAGSGDSAFAARRPRGARVCAQGLPLFLVFMGEFSFGSLL